MWDGGMRCAQLCGFRTMMNMKGLKWSRRATMTRTVGAVFDHEEETNGRELKLILFRIQLLSLSKEDF
jgi:hypothetical protein